MRRKKGKIVPLKMRTILKSLGEIKKEVLLPVSILVVGEKGVGKKSLINRMGPNSNEVFSLFELDTKGFSANLFSKIDEADIVLVVVDATKKISTGVRRLLEYLEGDKTPFVLIVNKIDIPENLEAQLKPVNDYLERFLPNLVLVSILKDVNIENELIPKIIYCCGDKKLSLSAKLPMFRLPVVEEIVKNTALQNAAIAGISLYPGADMPILTTNQIKMILKIAVAYGEEIDFSRAREILMVIGGGFTFRTIARELVSILPTVGFIAKAAVAYGGTIAVGRAAGKYFEKGISDLSVGEIKDIASETVRELKGIN